MISLTKGGPKLETKGTPNVIQSLLNLVQGTNITITDNGDGSVTIASTASGGPVFPLTIVQEGSWTAAANATSFTIPFAQATAGSGNTIFVLVAGDGNQTLNTPSGWTMDFNQNTGFSRSALLHKTTAGETNIVLTYGSTAGATSVYWFEVSGTHALDQSAFTAVTTGTPGQGIVQPPSLTPTNGAAVFAFTSLVPNVTINAMPPTFPVNPLWQPIYTGPSSSQGRMFMGVMYRGTATGSTMKPPSLNISGIGVSANGAELATFSIL